MEPYMYTYICGAKGNSSPAADLFPASILKIRYISNKNVCVYIYKNSITLQTTYTHTCMYTHTYVYMCMYTCMAACNINHF